RLDDEDRAGGRIAEVPRHAVVAELHPRVESRGVDEDGAGLREIGNVELDVDSADRVRHVHGRIERLAGELGLADAPGQLVVPVGDDLAQRVAVREGGFAPVVVRDLEAGLVRVRYVHHAG